jgi:tRNA pseudouridine38-40 synthase
MGSRIKLTVSYLGTGFHGWQRQLQQRTIQGELEASLQKLAGGTSITAISAGRTDAGVHAAGQVAHADLPSVIPPESLFRALNHSLPSDVRVRGVRQIHGGFHARRDAVAKHYVYRARWRTPTLPWLGLRTATFPRITDAVALDRASVLLRGAHDMASFTVPEVAARPTVRTLHRVWLRPHSNGVDFHFVGDGFLRYQVRRMVGALLAVGRADMTLEQLRILLDRPLPGAPIMTTPARGLTLEKVYYRRVPSLGF